MIDQDSLPSPNKELSCQNVNGAVGEEPCNRTNKAPSSAAQLHEPKIKNIYNF